MNLRFTGKLFLAACTFGFVCARSGAESLAGNDAGGQIRAALAGPSGQVFAAVYDRDAVWVFDAQTRQRTQEIPVGDGPVALALSHDGKTLACVNRMGNSVSLIATDTLQVSATLNTEQAPAGIVALPDGRFAVPNAFSDSVTIVAAPTAKPEQIPSGVVAPSAIAASETHVAVIGQGEAPLAIFAVGNLTQPRMVRLDGAPLAIAALAGNRFAVATSRGIVAVNAADGGIAARSELLATSLAFDDEHLIAALDDRLALLDGNLGETGSVAGRAEIVVARAGWIAGLSPKRKQFIVRTADAPVVAKAAPEPSPSETLPEPADKPAAEAPQAAPDQPPAEKKPETTPAKEVKPGLIKRFAAKQFGQPLSTASDTDNLNLRPNATPIQQSAKKSIAQAVVQPTEFASPEAGFQAPDWREPFRDLKADTMRQNLGSDRTEMSGNVHMNMGQMHFHSDEFAYSKKTGEVEAHGNVSIDQQHSLMRAMDFEFTMPPEDAGAPRPIFKSPEEETAYASKRLQIGRLHAKEILVQEPTRHMTADEATYDFGTKTGEFTDVRGQAGIFYYHADKLIIRGPGEATAENLWVTTCDRDPPHYRFMHSKAEFRNGMLVGGTNGRLMIGKRNTPAWIPKWRHDPQNSNWNIDFHTGRRAALGPYLNFGLLFDATPEFQIGPRIFLSEKEGVGGGIDSYYDFMEAPDEFLYRTKGEFHTLYTTNDRGYEQFFHRWEQSDKLVIRLQSEQWSDQDFYKDFFYHEYRNRTEPRTFANVTYTEDEYIATATVRPNTHSWVRETEQLPEATFHLLERPIAKRLYLAFDTYNGYYDVEKSGPGAARTINVARMTYSMNKLPRITITPYAEVEVDAYSSDLNEEAVGRVTGQVGTTFQSRLQRAYGGAWGFEGFKHIIVPSLTVSYRPGSSIEAEDTPQFDALDRVPGRLRVESKIDSVVYGRDAKTHESWQVSRLSLFSGNDLWNEDTLVQDYELEADVRPRPWWGLLVAAERHEVDNKLRFPRLQQQLRLASDNYESNYGHPFNVALDRQLDDNFPDYDRALTYLYYDDTPLGGRLLGRVGFAYTRADNRTYNRDIIYGIGGRLNENWFIRFEHIYDLSNNTLRQQLYEITRAIHCWQLSLRFRDRESGYDIDFAFGIRAFPGSKVRF